MDFDDSSLDFARKMDKSDELAPFRNQFCIPTMKDVAETSGNMQEAVYLCGNSLGLLPKRTITYVNRELDKWSRIGVLGHTRGELPWVTCEDVATETLASLLGCQKDEVLVMNNLTSDIHLMLASFYLPNETHFKLAIEGDAFPSDHYALESHLRLHGVDESDGLVVFRPRTGEDMLRTDDILTRIEQEGKKLAVVFISAVHYRTGQFFDIAPISEAAHRAGALIGLDLAHAVGNVPLHLDKWDVDFACACSYKYLNSGPGGIGICFVNSRHFERQPRLIGWCAHKLETRFVMDNKLELEEGAAGFKTGNQSPILCAALLAGLEIFNEAGGIEPLRKKSLRQTSYLVWLLTKSDLANRCSIVTPEDPDRRGCQLSIRIPDPPGVEFVGKELKKQGVVCDIRRPDVIRVAPVPLYNSFEDIYRFAVIFHNILSEKLSIFT